MPRTEVLEESLENIGATVMGRNMFGGEGPWGDDPWDGWWGDDPPFHTPVFIVTHHAREPVAKEGGTTFTFVTDGIESALEQAKEAAGGKDVALGGGANVAQQYLRAGLIDEMQLHVVPVLLGDGARLFDNLGGAELGLEFTRAVDAPDVTHLTYRVSEVSAAVRRCGARGGSSRPPPASRRTSPAFARASPASWLPAAGTGSRSGSGC